jgi:esterase
MKLHHRISGKGEPLMILHGLFGHSDNWQSIAKQLSEEYTIILVDLRNHGQSPHSDDWNYQLMAEDVKELADDLGFDKFYLAGHSMGGKVAMMFAQFYPERLHKLIVIDISPRYYPVHHHEIIDALLMVKPEGRSNRKEAENLLENSISDFATRQFLLKNLYWNEEQKLNWRFNLNVISENIEEVGKAVPDNDAIIDIPSLFIKGSKSGYVKTQDEELIHQQFSHAEIVSIEDAGHWVHAEKPQELIATLKLFLNS